MNGPGAYLKALELLAQSQEKGRLEPDTAMRLAITGQAYANLANAAANATTDPEWAVIAQLPREVVVDELTPSQAYASLPLWQIVRVTPFDSREEKPFYGKVVGYDMSRSKYQIAQQFTRGFGDESFSSHHSYYFPGEVKAFDPAKPQRIEVVLSVDVPRSFGQLGEDEIAEMACAELENVVGTQVADLEEGDLSRVRTVGWRRP
jgi:hypothetical protein